MTRHCTCLFDTRLIVFFKDRDVNSTRIPLDAEIWIPNLEVKDSIDIEQVDFDHRIGGELIYNANNNRFVPRVITSHVTGRVFLAWCCYRVTTRTRLARTRSKYQIPY